ncbi:Methyltransferase domain-containing protein [Candidatus Fervidibacteria bacterium JGI MDM2 SSWTFF-3-K9]
MELRDIHQALNDYKDLGGAKKFFQALRYPTIDPLPVPEIEQLPESAKKIIHSCHLISDCRPPQLFEEEVPTPSQFRIYHIELKTDKLRRTDFRYVLEPFYRRFPQGNNLFVFTLSQQPYRELAFVSPQRLLKGRRKDERISLHLRTLRVLREEPYRTDLEILQEIANPPLDPQAIWERHESAFNIERVTERFFEDYRSALHTMVDCLQPTKEEPRDDKQRHSNRFSYAQLLLNRLMVCYFLARKGWLVDGSGRPIRRYMRWLWKQYQQNRTNQTSFHQWLTILFRDAFNMELGRLTSAPIPDEVRHSFQTVPYLNGGLFAELEPDTFGYEVPDEVFAELLFGHDPDRDPKLLEKYNFTVDESRPFDEEMAVDPEMLGKVYESLIAVEERGEGGIFYTPRLEVDLMCRLSIAEYLHERLKLPRDKVLEFVFSPTEETLRPFSRDKQKEIEKALKECKIVDPAVGSGSFLIGALNVLCELLDALAISLERKRYDRYMLKRQLILNNLYGVDVKDWAVRVCELRLFLSLLVELPDGAPPQKSNEPILPNLDFRIRAGDSIIQEVPHIPHPIVLRKGGIGLPIHKTLRRLIEKKRGLEKTPPTRLAEKEKEIFNEERKIIAKILDHYIQDEQEALRQKEKLERGEPIPLFFWEVAFPEVFFPEDGEPGFDIVLANPPYVRQERIEPPTPLSPKNYKAAIQRNIKYLWDNQVEVPGRADLYVPFFFVGVSLLKPGGVLCFVTSNAWLDVDYGSEVQKFFLTKTRWLMTIDNLKRRTFSSSAINTVITLAVRPNEGEDVGENIVRFVAFRVPYEELN